MFLSENFFRLFLAVFFPILFKGLPLPTPIFFLFFFLFFHELTSDANTSDRTHVDIPKQTACVLKLRSSADSQSQSLPGPAECSPFEAEGRPPRHTPPTVSVTPFRISTRLARLHQTSKIPTAKAGKNKKKLKKRLPGS